MSRDEIKKIVSEELKKGVSLSNILKLLHDKHNERITFLDLRLLAGEIENIDWKASDKEEPKTPAPKKTAKKTEGVDAEEGEEDMISAEDGEWTSGTVVEISKLTRPGTALNGSVRFASGAKADWVLDQHGRLGLEKATGKPTPEDLKEFQLELQKKLSGMGG